MSERVSLIKADLSNYQTGLGNLENYKEQWRVKQAELEQNNAEILQNIDRLSTDLNERKDIFRELAIEEFKKTENKKLIGGLGIRIGVDLIYEETQAFDWAKEHSLCLELNKREFEKIAKNQEIDFVKKEDKITVTFPKKIEFKEEK